MTLTYEKVSYPPSHTLPALLTLNFKLRLRLRGVRLLVLQRQRGHKGRACKRFHYDRCFLYFLCFLCFLRGSILGSPFFLSARAAPLLPVLLLIPLAPVVIPVVSVLGVLLSAF